MHTHVMGTSLITYLAHEEALSLHYRDAPKVGTYRSNVNHPPHKKQ